MDLHAPYGLVYALAAMCAAYLLIIAILWRKSLPIRAHAGLD